MNHDRRTRTSPASPRDHGEPPRAPLCNILDALELPGVEAIEIEFDRPVSYPRPATFD